MHSESSIPDYSRYSLIDLYQALSSIDVDQYPVTYAALRKELGGRHPESRIELEECFRQLDKDRWPEDAERLRQQISDIEVPAVQDEVRAVPEDYKYKTFWRRFWAFWLDALFLTLVVFPVHFLVTAKLGADSPVNLWLTEFLQYLGLGYVILMHGFYGQTLGKMATGVKVWNIDEDRTIGFSQSVLRDSLPLATTVLGTVYLFVFAAPIEDQSLSGIAQTIAGVVGAVSLLWVIAEFVTMLLNKKRRAVHDFIARSVVLRVD